VETDPDNTALLVGIVVPIILILVAVAAFAGRR